MFPAANGDTVKIHYTGRLEDGTVFDSSKDTRPLQFIIGKEEVIPGFEEATIGMVLGEKKTVTVPAAKAYGPRDEKLLEEMSRDLLPADLNLEVGKQLEVTKEDGNTFLVMIAGLTDTEVTLDANHPLGGKNLVFDIEMLEVTKKPAA